VSVEDWFRLPSGNVLFSMFIGTLATGLKQNGRHQKANFSDSQCSCFWWVHNGTSTIWALQQTSKYSLHYAISAYTNFTLTWHMNYFI
jgi:hypothetical protein